MLDGKGGQLAPDRKRTIPDFRLSVANYADSPDMPGSEPVQSPVEEEEDEFHDWEQSMMLPPTVSTYSHKTQYIPPPPDVETLRRELRESLFHVTKTLSDVQDQKEENIRDPQEYLVPQDQDLSAEQDENLPPGQRSPARGWHEVQGMHILDVVTLAIRSAKLYYTTHEHPQRLSKIKSERKIREELLGVLDVLKRSATRNFAGGVREEEIRIMQAWVDSVEDLLVKEKAIEIQEARDRESWLWLEGNWVEGDRTREWLFMRTFLEDHEKLPDWLPLAEGETYPTPFLEAVSSGLLLVQLHNRILKKSKRKFGEIKTFHTDTTKHYRAADNLRYWIKEAEIRWETKLHVDVAGVIYNKGPDAWKDFDAAIFEWCHAVREDLTREWKNGLLQVSTPIPTAHNSPIL